MGNRENIKHATKGKKAMKIAMLFPYAPSYREGIYRLMDKKLDVDWYFAGNAIRNLRLLDYSVLRSCNLSMKEKHIFSSTLTRYKGIGKLPLKQYDIIIIAGVIRCVSEWMILLKYGRKKNGPKVYCWTHGWYGKETKLQKIIKKIFFSHVDGFLLYGDYAKSLMIKEGFNPNRLYVIKNSLDYDKQLKLRNSISESSIYSSHFKNKLHNIIFIGRLTPVKKLSLIIEAVKILAQKGYYLNLTFVGDGEEKENLQILVKKYGLEDRVWFYGESFDEKANANLIYNSDLCVAPGNVGLTAIHCLMFGCPVITHNELEWQMPEFEAIKEGETGAFFKKDDIASLANCILTWFEAHQGQRDVTRNLCYEEIDHFWNPRYQLCVIDKVLKNIL